MKKFILLLLFTTIFFMFPSCSSGDAGNNIGADDIPDASLTAETNDLSNDQLPERDYNGYEFNFYTRSNNTNYKYIIEEEIGEILNDAVYRRTRCVEDRFNIIFSETVYSDANAPRTYMLSGDDTYDVYNSRCTHALAFWLEGLTMEIPDLPYIDLNKSYWNKTANDSLTLLKHQYAAIGAANIGAYDFIFTLLFNAKLSDDFALPSLYDLVNSGKWTIDQMDEMMRKVSNDLNGDGIYDVNDRYGYASGTNVTLPAFWVGAGLLSVTKDKDDVPYFSAGEEKFIDVFNKVFEITWDTNAWYKNPDGGNVPGTSVTLFTENRSLFMDTQVFDINRLRGMETDFGIIPYPKYDEQQENYRVRFGFYDIFAVAKSNSDPERTSAVLEALNSESYKTVIPVYYELCLKTRNSRDEQSEAMLDLIFNNLIVDLGDTVWADKIRDGVFTVMFKANNRNIASRIDAMATSIQADIDKITAIK